MKIAAQGWLCGDLGAYGPEEVEKIRSLGFHGVTSHIRNGYLDVDPAKARAFREMVLGHGLDYLQLWGPYPCIITPDEYARHEAVSQVCRIVELAASMGMPAIGIRPTSLNPAGHWRAHRDNYSKETRERFIRSISEVLEVASDRQVGLVFECGAVSLLETPEIIKEIIDTLGSPLVKTVIDPVNFVADYRTAVDPTPMIHRLFDVLGPYCACVHIKDYCLENRHVIHVAEEFVGDGLMDLDTVLRRADELGPETYVVIEHLPVAQIPAAKKVLTRKIHDLGIDLAPEPEPVQATA